MQCRRERENHIRAPKVFPAPSRTLPHPFLFPTCPEGPAAGAPPPFREVGGSWKFVALARSRSFERVRDCARLREIARDRVRACALVAFLVRETASGLDGRWARVGNGLRPCGLGFFEGGEEFFV